MAAELPRDNRGPRTAKAIVSTRTKAIWLVSASCLVVILGAGLLLRLVPARPGAAIQTAENFVDRLRSHDLERAYQLTVQRGEVGRSPAEFQEVVRQQWPRTPPTTVRFLAARPFQSYGNRLRRWLQGREADPQEMWLEFSIDGMPFEVREARRDGGAWQVDFFQAHAE